MQDLTIKSHDQILQANKEKRSNYVLGCLHILIKIHEIFFQLAYLMRKYYN